MDVIDHMNRQALFGDPPACEWRSPADGQSCVLERHDGDIHATLPETYGGIVLSPGVFEAWLIPDTDE